MASGCAQVGDQDFELGGAGASGAGDALAVAAGEADGGVVVGVDGEGVAVEGLPVVVAGNWIGSGIGAMSSLRANMLVG